MDFFSVLALLGGLAIFLYGMNLMGDGLAKVAGGKLERILPIVMPCNGCTRIFAWWIGSRSRC